MIKYKQRFKQSIDFENIPASDIDVVMEYNDKYLFLFEMKYWDKEMPKWQETMLYRIHKAWNNSWEGKKAFVLLCSHKTKASDIIKLSDCTVTHIQCGNYEWDWEWTVKFILERIAKQYKIKKLLKYLKKVFN